MPCRPLKVYLINMAMGWVQQKKEIELDPKYKLPKMRYKSHDGNVTPQTMRMEAKPLVTEMRDIPEDPEFPLLTKKRPITVPGPPKAYKEPLKASTDPPQTPTARPSSVNQASPSSKPVQAKQTPSSATLKEAAARPPQAQAAATTSINGTAAPSGIYFVNESLVKLEHCFGLQKEVYTGLYVDWLLTHQGSSMCWGALNVSPVPSQHTLLESSNVKQDIVLISVLA